MRIRLALVLGVLLAITAIMQAQTFRGGIQGTVTDATGASIAGADVTVTSVDTGLTRTAQTDSAGNYAFTELPLGDYQVTASKAGFRTQTAKGIHVGVSMAERVNVQLTPGQVSEKVEVTAEVPLVETSSNTVGGTIEAVTVGELPVNGRDYTKLLQIVPGSTGDPSAVNDSPQSFGTVSVNGNRGRSNNFLIDGTDMNDGYRNDPAINEGGVFGVPATLLPVDAIAEMGILSGTQAEYGRNSGSVVNIVTKSGTNQLHGTVFEYFRNNHLDARNFFNTVSQPQAIFINNQFGGSLGGAIVKDKTFWYVAYEGAREKVGISTLAVVPTQADLTGATNPIIANLIAHNPWPAPNITPNAAGDNFQADTISTNRLDSVIAKIDQHIGKDNVLTGRYFFGDSSQSFPLGLVGGNFLPGYNTLTPTRVQIVSLSYTQVISSKLLIEYRGGYNRFAETFFPQDQMFDPRSIGLNTVSNPRDFGLPQIVISGFAAAGANRSLPRGRVDTNWQYFTNLSYNSGRHNIKVGYEIRRTSVNQFFDEGFRGKLSFSSLADFLSGTVDGGAQVSGDSQRTTYENSHGVYFQDNFKWTRKLTLNYGMRWDYYGVIGEKKGRFSLLDPTKGLELVGTPGAPSSLYPKDYKNFGPRVGIAYDMFGTGKTILRAGWGLFYDAYSQDFFVGQLPFNTFNAGPAYNGIGPSPVLFGGPTAASLTPVACGTPGSIAIPGSPLCAPKVFGGFVASDVMTVAQNLVTPRIQNYNANVQQQLGDHAALTFGYVGSQGRHLFRFRDINQANILTGVRPFDSGPFRPDGGQFGIVNNFESTASSTYNSLQLSFSVRNFHGLTSTTNYTWAHSIDNASDGQDYAPNASLPDNSFNPSAERASSNFDVRHRFVWYWTYEVPWKTQGMKWLTSGWAVDGVVTLATGAPFTVNSFAGLNGTFEFVERPDIVGDPFAGTHLPDAFLNLTAFQAPCSGSGPTCHFGSEGRNAFRGPNYRDWDLAFVKNNSITERVKMQLRVDFFNILNRPNFSNPLNPSDAVDYTTNGLDANGRGQGFFGITATPDVGAGNPFLGGGGPRNIELALKFTF